MTTVVVYIFYFIAVVIGWIIFYYVVKAAVVNGIKEARSENLMPFIRDGKPEILADPEQRKLQQRYDKGEIPFEVYQTEWNRLNSK